MRIRGEKQNINDANVLRFFENQAKGFDDEFPEASMLYAKGEQAKALSIAEIERVSKYVNTRDDMTILDIGCGIGRWADYFSEQNVNYIGIDHSQSIVDIARTRFNNVNNFTFIRAATTSVPQIVENQTFDLVLIAGLLNYLNDSDVTTLLDDCSKIVKGLLYIRVSCSIDSRLTLLDEWSEELDSTYNSIYRTVNEMNSIISSSDIRDFEVIQHGWLFDNHELNRRIETRQCFWILKRNT